MNLSNTFLSLGMYVRKKNGQIVKISMEPKNVDSNVVYGHFALYPDPILKDGTGMTVVLFAIVLFHIFLIALV